MAAKQIPLRGKTSGPYGPQKSRGGRVSGMTLTSAPAKRGRQRTMRSPKG